MERFFRILCLNFFLIASAISADRIFVTSVEDFFEHTSLHRERVKVLGVELFKTHPDLFQGLSLDQVIGALEAHDRAKVTTFYRNYGNEMDNSLVDALNAKDREFLEEAFNKLGVTDQELRAKILRIEKIADMVDRGMSEVSPEEFGRTMKKASEYLLEEADRNLALELEMKYPTLTEKWSYRKPDPIRRMAIAHQLKSECFQRSFATLRER